MALIIHPQALIGYHDWSCEMMDTIIYNTSSWHARTLTFWSFWDYLLVIQWMAGYWAPHVDLQHSLQSYPKIYTTEVLAFCWAPLTQKHRILLYTVHHVVEHTSIVHLYEFIQSSIALSNSMPFTWCVLFFPNEFSHHAQSTVLFPLISTFFSTQQMTWALNLPHFDFMPFIYVTATCGTVQWLCFP